ncbi:MAG: hypothetical protein RL148_1354 [Planctomycetota bacterium]
MSKWKVQWRSPSLGREITVCRYGVMGTPLLLFPTAGGDAEEPERFHLIDAIGDLIAAQRLKVYTVDSVAGQAWLKECKSLEEAARVQNRFDDCVMKEVVPHIRRDCQDDSVEILTTGASIGAFNALAVQCRHPETFRAAICMSGTYDMERFLEGRHTVEYHHSSPLHFVPHLPEASDQLKRLRDRFVLLAHGEGDYEDPDQSWRVASALGGRNVPNRVDAWGKEWRHDWVTWRRMLPQYLAEFLPS